MREHIFFDSLDQWLQTTHKDHPVYCFPFTETYPSKTEGIKLVYSRIQVSQVLDEYVHHLRIFTGQHTDPDISRRRTNEAKKQNQVFKKVLTWLQEQDFTEIRQGFLSFHRESRCIEIYLPKVFDPHVENAD